MVFSSTIFLFLFLPLVLCAYFLAGHRVRNLVLLTASLFFYAWGENIYVLLMLASILINYVFGLLIDRARRRGRRGKKAVSWAIALNLAFLGFFKYGNFLVDNLNRILSWLHIQPVTVAPIHLPIGISFFTFQAMSYVIDLYRDEVKVEKNPINIALYISLFPQLIAGPIVRYHDIASRIRQRVTTTTDLTIGIRRFIIGLGKKVLVANVLGRTADYLFTIPASQLPLGLAWIGALAYSLQIYYDFSGYSDMAIGLGRMFGFHFLENFNYPYISRSIREFWRRWHISLSTWFRDYLYIPLGGSRGSTARTYFNLITVFFLCGLWHGASWTFVVWGLFHGFFLILERTAVGNMLKKLPSVLRYGYAMLVVVIGWVLFRADNFAYALGYIQAMFTPGREPLYNSQIFLHINNEFILTMLAALIGMTPLPAAIMRKFSLGAAGSDESGSCSLLGRPVMAACQLAGLGAVYLYSVASIMGGAYNPFLYFRF